MGQSSNNPFKQGSDFMEQYHLEKHLPTQNITYLRHKQTDKQYLLRQYTFNDMREFNQMAQKLKKKKEIANQHYTNLVRIQERTEDQMCSNFYKIYTLWQFAFKNLGDEIGQRDLRKAKFQQQQLWSILACSIMSMADLQRKDLKHQCLNTRSILRQESGNIRILEPLVRNLQTNLDSVYHNRNLKNIYLSPEECESLELQRPIINKNSYKNDVFTMGMILLECGLLERQDKCYLDDCGRINWKKVEENTERFGKTYRGELKSMVELMVRSDINNRPDWINLDKYVNKQQNYADQSANRTSKYNSSAKQNDHTNRNPIISYQDQMISTSPPKQQVGLKLNQPQQLESTKPDLGGIKNQGISRTFNHNISKEVSKDVPSSNPTNFSKFYGTQLSAIPSMGGYSQYSSINPSFVNRDQSNLNFTSKPPNSNNYVSNFSSGVNYNFEKPKYQSGIPSSQSLTGKFQSILPFKSSEQIGNNSMNQYQPISSNNTSQPKPQDQFTLPPKNLQNFPSNTGNLGVTFGKQQLNDNKTQGLQFSSGNYSSNPITNSTGFTGTGGNSLMNQPVYNQNFQFSGNLPSSINKINPPPALYPPSQFTTKVYQNSTQNMPNSNLIGTAPFVSKDFLNQPFQTIQSREFPKENSQINSLFSDQNIRPAQSVTYDSYKTSPYEPQQFQSTNKQVNNPAITENIKPFEPVRATQTLEEQPQHVEEIFKQGSKYIGFKLNGMRHGRGKFYYQDGGSYDGEWKENKMDGNGVLYYQSNKIAYDGEWKNDQFQGYGKLFNESPQHLDRQFDYRNFEEIDQFWQFYEGQFMQDLKQGKGALKFSNGEVFEGNFKNDQVDGEGVFHSGNGNQIRGIWSQNQLVQIKQ